MAQIIQFDVLDLGLPGGALYGAGTVKTVLNLTYGQPRSGGRMVSMPNVDFVAFARSGYAGETITGRGTFDAASNADLNALETSINAYKTDPAKLGGKTLVEDASAGGRSRTSVVLTGFRLTGPRRQAAGGRIVAPFEITFEVLIP